MRRLPQVLAELTSTMAKLADPVVKQVAKRQARTF